MSENNEDTGAQQSERELLMERADDMGISYSKNIKTETLRDRVNAKIAGEDVSDEGDEDESADAKEEAPKKETDSQRRARVKAEATKLVRVRVTCMNPNKRNYTGEYFSVGNSLVPTMSRYVHFDEEWHVPQMMYQMIKNRKVQVFVPKRVDGKTIKVPKLIPEFSIDLLPDLTEKELKELALNQARRAGNSDE